MNTKFLAAYLTNRLRTESAPRATRKREARATSVRRKGELNLLRNTGVDPQ
jgi:hypothetical protein